MDHTALCDDPQHDYAYDKRTRVTRVSASRRRADTTSRRADFNNGPLTVTLRLYWCAAGAADEARRAALSEHRPVVRTS
jgi:hypothetical protein